jgi:hypothetical protein
MKRARCNASAKTDDFKRLDSIVVVYGEHLGKGGFVYSSQSRRAENLVYVCLDVDENNRPIVRIRTYLPAQALSPMYRKMW